MRRSVFSITTMASSTTMPIASTSANSVSTLMVNPSSSRPRNVPTTLTGTASIGMSVARQLWRKMNTTSVTSSIASTSVVTTSLIDAVTNGVVSNGILYCDARREVARELVHALHHRLLGGERVGARPEVEQQRRHRLAVETAGEIVVARAEHHLADVAHPDDRAVGLGADHDVGELLRRLEPAERRDRQGELGARRAPARGRAGRRGS